MSKLDSIGENCLDMCKSQYYLQNALSECIVLHVHNDFIYNKDSFWDSSSYNIGEEWLNDKNSLIISKNLENRYNIDLNIYKSLKASSYKNIKRKKKGS